MSKNAEMGQRCISSTIISRIIIRSSLVQVLEYKQHNEVSNNKIELGVTEELLAGFKIRRVSTCRIQRRGKYPLASGRII
jgi:hypothetical protein